MHKSQKPDALSKPNLDIGSSAIQRSKKRWRGDLERLQQHRLLSESSFLSFARDRGLPAHGVIEGEPGELWTKKLLSADGQGADGEPYFHPFRLYPLAMLLQADLKLLGSKQITERAREWNCIADLAILLEPLYWPEIVQSLTRSLGAVDHDLLLGRYQKKVDRLVQQLDTVTWSRMHENLRMDASWMDENQSLYLLLRLSIWDDASDSRGRSPVPSGRDT